MDQGGSGTQTVVANIATLSSALALALTQACANGLPNTAVGSNQSQTTAPRGSQTVGAPQSQVSTPSVLLDQAQGKTEV